jgi:hypothetical protein
LVASSLFIGLDDVDTNRWLVTTLADWNSLPDSINLRSSTDPMIDRFLKRSEELTASVFTSPQSQNR